MDPFPENINNINIVKQLIESGTDINKKYDTFHETLLHVASYGHYKTYIDIVAYLIKSGADINVMNSVHETPLYIATCCNQVPIVKLLIESGGDINETSGGNLSLLSVAARMGHFEMVKYLVKSGANMDLADYDNNTPLHCVAMGHMDGYIGIAKYLLDHGADFNIVNSDGDDAYRVAVLNNNNDIAEYIGSCVPVKGVFLDDEKN